MDWSGASHVVLRSLFGDPRPAAHGPYTPAPVSLAVKVTSVCLNLITLPILGACLTRRVERIQQWRRLPVSAWLLLLIYTDSLLFIFVTVVLKDIGFNTSPNICDGAILLCLVCYMSTKVLIYCFLVERSWIVRGCLQKRSESKLYLFNCFGMLLPYTIAVVLNFVWRIAFIDTKGNCIVGMEIRALMPLITFEVVVNIYLNILFIIPLRKMYSYRRGNGNMRRLALRTFVGSCATLFSSVVNLTVLMSVGGEPAWMCLMLCNADILFCVLVLHWVTSFDGGGGTNKSSCSHPSHDPLAPSVVSALRVPETTLQRRKHFFSCSCEDSDFPEGSWRANPWDVGGLAQPTSVLDDPNATNGVNPLQSQIGDKVGIEEKSEGQVEMTRVISDVSDASQDMEIRPVSNEPAKGTTQTELMREVR
ncbi:hypothetical protein CBER1_09430 [Cercospora berteroae]|uniref:Uncharacterized protein n=1 Tax=Cercospora berteroae TaxID=357750 RepID=A0A2S6BWF7_9PEZI|nr:hypothetical protein CBER1_09430 [Cercospora berteroae]